MKKIFFVLLAMVLTTVSAKALADDQPQVPNGDFESWTFDGENLPDNWNSFQTATGTMASMGYSSSNRQVKRSTDVRPGSNGQYSCSIWARSVFGVAAQGNLTSGRVYAGSASAANKANYNYTDRVGAASGNGKVGVPCAMPFTGRPSAVKVWVKYVQGGSDYGDYNKAKFSAIIHSNADYISYGLPEYDTDENKALVVASAVKEIEYNDGKWEELTIPFEYTDNGVEPAYIQINASTNAYPGKGKANDYLYIDDIEMVYESAGNVKVFEKDPLCVTVNGTKTGPYDSAVYVTENGDNTINFLLKNFMLNQDGDVMPIGNINVNNIPVTKAGGITNFSDEQTIQIKEGDDSSAPYWAGPMLGDISLKLAGKYNDEHLYVTIDIPLGSDLQLYVEIGTDMSDNIQDEGALSKTIENGVDYYIMNVETDQFLGAQNSWGTQGAISEDAGIYQFVPGTSGEGYNIVNTLISVTNKNLGTNLFSDTNGLATVKDDVEAGTTKSVDGIWSIEDQGGGIFAFRCVSEWKYEDGAWVEIPHGYLCKSETPGYRKGYELMFSESITDACLFRVFTYQEALEYMVSKAQSSNVNFNFLIKNPDFCRSQSTAAWTVSADCTNKNLAGGNNNNMCAESWRSTFTISQIVKDLPAGRYQLSAQGFYQRYDSNTDPEPYVFAGDTKVALPVLNGPENSMTTASQAFTAGKYMIDPVRFNLEEKTDLEIGFQCMSKSMWVIWDNIQLMSYSNVAEYGQEMLTEINKTYPIEGLASVDVRRAYEQAYRNFATFVADIQQGVQTFDDVDAEYAAFVKAEKALKASIESWSSYAVVAEKAMTLYEQITVQEGKYKSNTSLDALNSYINANPMEPGSSASGYTFVNGNYAYIAKNASLNAENVGSEIDFVNSLMNDVKRNSVQDGMDVTFLLTNADFKDPNVGEGWTRESSSFVNWYLGRGLSGWPVSETYIPSNGGTFDIFQIVEGAPAGLYKVTVNAFHRPAGAWDAETKVPVALYMGSIANPIQNIAKGAIKNDLVWSDEEQKWLDGEVAKNGTNCYFWDGNSAKDDAAKAAIWAGNQNPDPEIQAMIAGSTSLTGAGKYNSDSQYNESYLIPNGMDGASIAFSAGRYPMVVYGEVPDEGDGVGTLKIGLKTLEPLNSGAWTLWGGFKLELAGTDPGAMKDLLKGQIDEMKALVPDATDAPGIAGVVLDSINNITSDAEDLYNNPVLQDYEDYKEAYDALEHLIGSANKYLEAYSKLSADLTSLNNMISAFNADTPAKQALKAKAESVADVYTNLPAINCICLTPEDLENDKIWEDETFGGVPEDVTNDNLADAAASGQDGGYVTTYSQFNAFYAELVQQLDCIYLKVDGTSLADDPQEITRQLRNPDLVTEDQWWGTSWGYIGEQAAEQYSKTFDTYQRVWMPAGYYTVAGYAMDRRGSWTDVIKNDADWRAEDATWLYAKVGDADTLQTQVFNAKSVAQTWDITEGAGNIYSYDVDGVTWYAPNSMESYRNWMDAKGDFIFGTALQFYVPEATYASLGFFRRAFESTSWFAIDDIKLYYAVDDYPEIDMDPVEPEEEGDYIIDCSKTFRGGVVSADRKKANAGESVTFTAVPNTNFYLDGMTLELTVEAEDAQARPVNQSRVAVLTTVELPMTYDAETGVYTGVYEMTNSNVTLVAANFMPKQAQKIVAEDVNVYETAVDVAVVAENQTEGGAALRYAVAEGNDVVEVNAETGALTILKSGMAVIEITADETEKCKKTTATVNVTIKAVVKKTVTLVRGMATFYDPINAYVIPEDAKVWTGQVDASQEAVIMSEITGAIPAATPVLITGESATVTLTPDLENADEPVVSDLKPTDDFKDRIMDGSENVYALHYGAFIHVTSGSMPAGKAYINYEKFGGNNGARLAIIFDEETGIANVKAKDAGDDNSPIFDLMGRRLARKPASGYYIQNGVRYFVK